MIYKYHRIFLVFLVFLVTGFTQLKAEEALTWQDCIKEAVQNNPDLISAEESVKESQASKKITASSAFPQIDSSVSTSTAKASGETTDSYSFGASATQLLFDGLKTRDNVKAASENIKAAQFNYKFTSSEVRLRLRTAFINLLKTQELLKITQDIYNIRRNNLELITLRYESGIEHKGALLTAEANLAQAEFEISQTKRALEAVQRELVKEMGRTKFLPLQVTGEFKVSDTVLEKPDFEKMADENPSLGKLMAQKNAASFGIKTAQANFFPQLSAQAGANRSSSHWPPEDNRWSAGLTVSFPIFEGGLRMAQVAKAEAVFNQAKENERSTKDGIVVAIEQAWNTLQDAVETAEVEKKFLDATQERAKIAEAQYALGLTQFDNWTIIEDSLVRAKKTFLDAQTNALLAQAKWIQAKGETLEYAD